MQRIMKSSTVKKIVVKVNDVSHEVAVDSDDFNDIYVEATTRVVEQYKKDMSFFHKMLVVAECYEKRRGKKEIVRVNMYHILINAGLYSIAGLLREKTKNLHNVDLQFEPVRGEADGTTK